MIMKLTVYNGGGADYRREIDLPAGCDGPDKGDLVRTPERPSARVLEKAWAFPADAEPYIEVIAQ
jgi:hypothetical protein